MNIIRKLKNNKFIYILKGDIIKDEKELERIKKMNIPPAWINVSIADNAKNDVLAIGEDSKGRVQYLYSKEWNNNQEKIKFIRLIYFSKNINYIRKYLKQILKEEGWFKEKMKAFIISVIDNCGLRIGNEKYKELYDTDGITTLKKEHISILNTKIKLKFIGKKNVENTCTITNNFLLKLFKDLYNYNKDSTYFFSVNNKIISNNSINNFLRKFGDYTIKDFRTYRANIDFIKCLYNKPIETTPTKIKKTINICLKEIADKLNNTKTVLKNKYICNIIIEKYLENPQHFNTKVNYYKKNALQNVDMYESALLYYLNKYKNI